MIIGELIGALFIAFITGALARFALPGPDPMPPWLTLTIGFVGFLGGTGIVLAIGGRKAACLDGPREFRRRGRARGDLPALRPEAAALGEGRLPLPRAWFRRRAIPRAAEAGRHRSRTRSGASRSGSSRGRRCRCRRSASNGPSPDGPTENPAHYLGLLEELHDTGVLERRRVQRSEDAAAREPALSAGSGARPRASSRRATRGRCARRSSRRPPRGGAARAPRRAAAAAAGRAPARSRRPPCARRPPTTSNSCRSLTAAWWMWPPRISSAPRVHERSAARGSGARPAACAPPATARRSGGGGGRRRGALLLGRGEPLGCALELRPRSARRPAGGTAAPS